ncbi:MULTISPECIES: hypothetical protein [Arthrobacter]|uniref:Uncharacterized protein n=1 Tax=Arthrobacter terricola TaxID=2547396 RepID=A0A4R5K5Z3_9MICC|nr:MULTISPECIES: hypothetical protein [Arthrobacter]MBT8163068.1 hypothetical protein [Arthrobacter sp. GN70]TDF88108.1 hypothetical protein E1809_24115 [Arthrobacter terricola]
MADETFVHVGDQVFKVELDPLAEQKIITALRGGELASFGSSTKVLGSEEGRQGRLVISEAQTVFIAKGL